MPAVETAEEKAAKLQSRAERFSSAGATKSTAAVRVGLLLIVTLTILVTGSYPFVCLYVRALLQVATIAAGLSAEDKAKAAARAARFASA